MSIEYGARLPHSGTVYMKSDSLPVVEAWLQEYCTVTPLELVFRERHGDTSGHWIAPSI